MTYLDFMEYVQTSNKTLEDKILTDVNTKRIVDCEKRIVVGLQKVENPVNDVNNYYTMEGKRSNDRSGIFANLQITEKKEVWQKYIKDLIITDNGLSQEVNDSNKPNKETNILRTLGNSKIDIACQDGIAIAAFNHDSGKDLKEIGEDGYKWKIKFYDLRKLNLSNSNNITENMEPTKEITIVVNFDVYKKVNPVARIYYKNFIGNSTVAELKEEPEIEEAYTEDLKPLPGNTTAWEEPYEFKDGFCYVDPEVTEFEYDEKIKKINETRFKKLLNLESFDLTKLIEEGIKPFEDTTNTDSFTMYISKKTFNKDFISGNSIGWKGKIKRKVPNYIKIGEIVTPDVEAFEELEKRINKMKVKYDL